MGLSLVPFSKRFQEQKSLYIIISILTSGSCRSLSFTSLKHPPIVVYSVFKYVKQPHKSPELKRSRVEFFPQLTFTVPRMRSVSEMYDTVRGVCPALTKQSFLALLRKQIIGLNLTNQLTRDSDKESRLGLVTANLRNKSNLGTVKARGQNFLSRLFAH